jgi:dienelactone hydrolase
MNNEPEAPELSPAQMLTAWFPAEARRLRGGDLPPASRAGAGERAAEIRRRMAQAEGTFFRAGLQAHRERPRDEIRGVIERPGYRIERLLIETLPDCWATATTYVPTGTRGRLPAVLGVHGHWAGARRDPVVQSRCIGLAKLGFFVLSPDAWGAGERGTVPGQNEYHGGLLGASLWPVGTPLHGLQLLENIRFLDYLQARSEVDPERIGCTGASGGGNQTTYLSAFDERVKCAVPVCSVGTFADYLSVACCVDEVLNGALTFAEEGDLLGCIAPRALMVISAERDVYHFGPESARNALGRARPVFDLYEANDRLRHAVFDSGHDYNQAMREAMYGWMRRWLQQEGDGSPVPEPEFTPEDPEALRCFTPPFRPARVMTTLRWVQDRAEAWQSGGTLPPEAARQWNRRTRDLMAHLLRLPEEPLAPRILTGTSHEYLIESEPGIRLPLTLQPSARPTGEWALLLHPGGRKAALAAPEAEALRREGIGTAALELRGCGDLTLPNQALGEAIPDHNLVEWSLWIGRPLMGQWIHDIRQVLTVLPEAIGARPDRLSLVGWREGALAAVLAAPLTRARSVRAIELPASLVPDAAPHQVRMVVFTPQLCLMGDVPQLVERARPRTVRVESAIRLDGAACTPEELARLFGEAAAPRTGEVGGAGNE